MTLLLFLTLQPEIPRCTVLACTDSTCTIGTPEGVTTTWRRRGWKDGDAIVCPSTDIEPTGD
jgi:hypothetical protein